MLPDSDSDYDSGAIDGNEDLTQHPSDAATEDNMNENEYNVTLTPK